MPKQPAFPGLTQAMKKKRTAARAVSRGDGRGGALAPAAGADRAALSQDRGEGWTAADAARDDAAGAFPAAVVCAQRSDGGKDAV